MQLNGVCKIFWRSKGGFERTPSNPPCLRACHANLPVDRYPCENRHLMHSVTSLVPRPRAFVACSTKFAQRAWNLVMYRLPHEKKNYGFTPNLDFNPLPTRFNLPSFCLQEESMQHIGEKRTSKHGISIVLKLVSIEYQKRDTFLAAL